ncbi:hypothetical protein [Altericroceibacterium xinjiangense]|uniref:hypothetical protein n=1 Tax=Altericroceibacterium xinjiangense TaxID=762261 RepID=UPI000F7DA966|nr:hypothetical protein [Altericroceibacterium xinjiangense]
MISKRFAVYAASFAAVAAAAPALASPPDARAPLESAGAPVQRELSEQADSQGDTAQVMAALQAFQGDGQAAPNPEAQKVLDELTSLMASRTDADGQAAAEMMRKFTGRTNAPRPSTPKE